MPQYQISVPGQGTFLVDSPTELTDLQAWQAVKRQLSAPSTITPPPQQSTITGELLRGGKQLVSSVRTGLESLLSPEEAAIAGVERGQKIAEEAGEGPSLAAVRKAYEERGLLPAAGEVVSQIPRALAGQGAQIAAMAGGARLGATAGAAVSPFLGPAAPLGPIVGGVLGAGATLLPQFMGANVERQAREQMERGEAVDIDRTAAYGTAAGQAALESAGTAFVFGKRLVKGVLGIADDAALASAKAQQELAKAASRSVAAAAGRGAVRGTAEIPVEIAQAVLERAQAGLDLTSPEALTEYGENAYLAGLVGPTIGSVTSVMDRNKARAPMEGQLPGETLEQSITRLQREILAETQPPAPPPAEPDFFALDSKPYGYGLLEQAKQQLMQGEQTERVQGYLQEISALQKQMQAENDARTAQKAGSLEEALGGPEILSQEEMANILGNEQYGWAKLFQYKNSLVDYLKQQTAQKRAVAPELLDSLKSADALLGAYNVEDVRRRTTGAKPYDSAFTPPPPPPPPITVVDDKVARGLGFVPSKSGKGIYNQIVNKDLTDPAQLQEVRSALETYVIKGNGAESTIARVSSFLKSIPRGEADVGTPVTPPSGEGAPVAIEPSAGAAPAGVGVTQPSGVVPPVEDAGLAPRGEEGKPAAIKQPGQTLIQRTDQFGADIGATRPYRGELRGRVNLQAQKAAESGNFNEVISALEKSKNATVAAVAKRAKGLGTNIVIDDNAEERYEGQSPLMRQMSIDGAKMHLEGLELIRSLAPQVDALPDNAKLPMSVGLSTIQQFDNGKNVGNASLERIAEMGHSMFDPLPTGPIKLRTKEDFKALQQGFEDITQKHTEDALRLTSTGSAKMQGVAGAYDADTDTIRVPSYSAKREDVLAHEVVHAQTLKSIANPTEAQKPAVARLNNLYRHVKNTLQEKAKADKNYRLPYGLESIQEFMAEGMSNPKFQFELNEIEYKNTSAWDAFVQYVADLIGVKKDTAFTELLSVYSDLTPQIAPPPQAQQAPRSGLPDTEVGGAPAEPATTVAPGAGPAITERDEYEQAVVDANKAARKVARKSPSLWTRLRGQLDMSDVNDISSDRKFRILGTSGLGQKRGKSLSTFVADGMVDEFLPFNMRHDVATFDEYNSTEYIKDRLREGNYLTYEAQMELEQISMTVAQLEENIDALLQEKEVNELIQEAVDEQVGAAEEAAPIEPRGEAATAGAVSGEEAAVKPKKSLAAVPPTAWGELERRAKATREAPPKEAAPEEKPTQQLTPETQKKIKQLQGLLKTLMNRFGLKDVGLNLVNDLEANGEYANKLIKLALDAVSPVRDLRHESLHALKELGFFTPQQWAVLEKKAKDTWIDQFLKQRNVNGFALQEGQQSRYDAYVEMFTADQMSPDAMQEALIEEAISDAFGEFDVNKAPPGLMQAILKRMKTFFAVIKEALGQARIESAEEIFERVERGELAPAKTKAAQPPKYSLRGEVPLSTRSIMEANDDFARANLGLNIKPVRGIANKVRDIAIALNAQTQGEQGVMDRQALSMENEKAIANAIADEVAYQLTAGKRATGSGLGWYSTNYPNAVKRLGKRFPELETNPHARSVFSALVAVTSNGEKVTKNISNATELYSKLRAGKPLVAMGNRRATALENNLQVIQDLLARHGTDFEKVLLQEITVKDMNAQLRAMGLKSDGSYLANTRVPAAAVYFGPKLGAFYANLSGSEGYLTMDLWWTRSINRMRGLLLPKATEASINKMRDMIGDPSLSRDDVVAATVPLRNKYEEYGFTTELEHLVGKKEPAKKEGKPAWDAKAKRVAGAAYEQLLYDHNLEKMANTIYKNEFEGIEEAPFTATDRAFMYRAGRRAQALLRGEGIDLTLADIQAALWYYEKRLYEKLSGKKADDIGYEEAIIAQADQADRREGPSVVFPERVGGRDVTAGKVTGAPEVRGEPTEAKPEGLKKSSLRAPQTEAFKRWFGDSKVVDENGEPLVVYHGTNADITKFDPAKQDPRDAGFWFANAPVYANQYAAGRDGGNVMPVYLSLQNPKIYYDRTTAITPELVEKLKDQGFDGIVRDFAGGAEAWRYAEGQREYAVFQPNQIKSAIGNIGTYDITSPDIRKSLRNTNSKEFKQWFGNSQIVDEDGQPLVMYHGSARDITTFRGKQAGAIFLTKDPGFAEVFSSTSLNWMARHADQFLNEQQVKEGKARAAKVIKDNIKDAGPSGKQFLRSAYDYVTGKNPNAPQDIVNYVNDELVMQFEGLMPTGPMIYPVYVKAEKAFDYENKQHIDDLERYEKDNRYTERSISNDIGFVRNGSWEVIESKRIQDAIKSLGYDAFYVKEGAEKNLAVYSSDQIKSATGNVGAYGQRPITAEEAGRAGMTEAEAAEAQKRGDIRFSLRDKATRISDLYVDVPNEDWLKGKVSYAKQKGRDKFGVPFMGTITAGFRGKFVDVPVSTLIDLPGQRKEQENVRQESLQYIRKNWDEVSKEPPYIEVAYNGEPWVSEGNHRIMVAAEKGIDSLPVEIRYFDGGERKDGPLKPSNILADEGKAPVKASIRDKKSVRNNLSPATRSEVDRVTTARYEPGFVERITKAIAPEAFSKLRAQALNRYNQLGVYDKLKAKQMGGVELLADQSAEAAALMSDLGAGVTAQAMGVHDRVGGIPVYRKGYTTVSNEGGTVKGIIAIFAPLAKYGDPEVYRDFQFWAGSKRGSRFLADGTEKLYTPANMRQAQEILKVYPEFETIFKEWTKYNEGLVKYMVDTGVISEANGKKFIQHSDYIPFYRQIDGETTVGPNIFQSIAGVKAPKKIKHGEEPLADFLETIVRNTQASIQAGLKNVAAQRAVKMAEDIGEATRLPNEKPGVNIVTVLENGKKVSYECNDPLFINAVKSLNLPDLPFIGLLAGPANLLRNLVTKDPGFMLANMMRDSMSAMVTSGVNMTPIVSTIKNFGDAIAGKSPEYDALLKAGVLGGYDYSAGVEASAQQLAKELRKEAKVSTAAEKAMRPATWLWEALEKGTQASDAATRIEVYKKTLEATGNEAEALFRALEVMNFNRKGSSAVIRIATAAIPFLNARMQGLDVLYRAAISPSLDVNATERAKQIQKTFFVRGMTIAALSCMYWMMTHDEDEYKKQEQETRDNYWLFPSLGIKIPIPFEVGIIFKVIPERIMAYTFGDDTGKDFMKSMKRNFENTLPITPMGMIPQLAKPYAEVTMNYSLFTGRPIIGQGMETVDPKYQSLPMTATFLKDLGEKLNISPIKMEYLIRGYTGTIGSYMVDAIDSIYNMNVDAPRASKRFEQMPVLKRFALDPEARGTVTAYYDLKNAVDTVVRTSNYLERTQNYEAYAKYLEDNMEILVAKDYVLDMYKTLSDFNEYKQMIRGSEMSADEKRDALLQITEVENQLTANIQTFRKMAKQ